MNRIVLLLVLLCLGCDTSGHRPTEPKKTRCQSIVIDKVIDGAWLWAELELCDTNNGLVVNVRRLFVQCDGSMNMDALPPDYDDDGILDLFPGSDEIKDDYTLWMRQVEKWWRERDKYIRRNEPPPPPPPPPSR